MGIEAIPLFVAIPEGVFRFADNLWQFQTTPHVDDVDEVDYDERMWRCLQLWKRNPMNLSLLNRVGTLCYRRQRELWGGPVREINFIRFVIVSTLSILSSTLENWFTVTVDWRLFADEDEIMVVRPYVKRAR